MPHSAKRHVEKPISAVHFHRRARDHTCELPPSQPGPSLPVPVAPVQSQGLGDGGDDRSGTDAARRLLTLKTLVESLLMGSADGARRSTGIPCRRVGMLFGDTRPHVRFKKGPPNET